METTGLPELVIIGDPKLMQPQPPVDVKTIDTSAFQHRLKVLKACMHAYQGIGIAAPQIGWEARVFCLGIEGHSARYPDAEAIEFGFWINPSVTPVNTATNWAWEGCLSVPGMRGWVQRPEAIVATGLDEHGRQRSVELAGFAARVFQHEFDHLDGRLYPSRVADPRWLLPDPAMAQQDRWPADWPSQGAHRSRPGELSTIA